MICHKEGVAINKMKVAPLYPLFKFGRKMFITHKNYKSITIGLMEL